MEVENLFITLPVSRQFNPPVRADDKFIIQLMNCAIENIRMWMTKQMAEAQKYRPEPQAQIPVVLPDDSTPVVNSLELMRFLKINTPAVKTNRRSFASPILETTTPVLYGPDSRPL